MKNFFYVFLILMMTSCLGSNGKSGSDVKEPQESKFSGKTFELGIIVNFHARPQKYGYDSVKTNTGNTLTLEKRRYLSKSGIVKATGHKSTSPGFYGLYLYLDDSTERELATAMMQHAGRRGALIVDDIIVAAFEISDEGKNPAVKIDNKVFVDARFSKEEVETLFKAFNK